MKANKTNLSLANNHLRRTSGLCRDKENQFSLYATNGSSVQEFIHRRENFIEDKIERRQAVINKSGFISALVDGFNSDGNKRLEINLTETSDFSLNQNGGFSIFFWFLLKKQTEGIHRFILKKGITDEELTPAIGILPNGSNLFVKMNSSKNKVENLFSNRKIEMNRMYSLLATFSIDYHNDLTDISLYLDGCLDSQVTVLGQPVHNQGNLFIGRCDNINPGFVGCVADVIYMPRVVNEEEINNMHQECSNNFKVNKIFQSYEIFSYKLEKDYLIKKYMQFTGNPSYVIENLQMSNDELKEIIKNYDDELRKEMEAQIKVEEIISEEARIINKLKSYLGDNYSDFSVTFKKLATNGSFIYTVLYLVNEMQDELSPKRIQIVLEILNETLLLNSDEKMIFNLAKIMNALSQNDTMVKLQNFFKNLKLYVANIFPEYKIINELSIIENNSKINFGETYNFSSEAKSVELHQNLLRTSQNFKNYFDDDIEKELGKSSFSIRSLYTRTKSGRPFTARNFYSERAEDTDMVNQQLEDMLEKKNQLAEVEEEKEEDRVNMISNENFKEKSKENSVIDSELIEKQKNDNLNAEIKNYVVNEETNLKNADQNDVKVKNENFASLNNPEEKKVNDQNIKDIATNHKSSEILSEKEKIKYVSENAKENNETSHNNKSKFSERYVNNEKLYDQSANNFGESGMPTNNDDIVSNFENRVLVKTSGRDSQKFSDVDNMIPIDNIALSEELNGYDHPEENFNLSGELIAKFLSDWALGQFELVIDHCYDCHLHKLSTRHYEYSYVDKFNEIAENVKNIFPNIKIIGNYGKPEYLGSFDVYLRGVGPRLDEKNRYYIYRKINTKKFPTKYDIIDRLIALVLLYGSSINMQAAQIQYLKAFKDNIPKPFKKVHEHPTTYSEEAEREKHEYEKLNKKMPELDPERTKICCLNWGCNAIYVKVENGSRVCRYHPGVWQFGSYHAYWPEAWSCCEGKWGDPGCTIGPHKGVRLNKRIFLCVNHGEINPKTHHPDSACGSFFTLSDQDSCKFHPGYVKNSTWTCCNSGREMIEGCQKGNHVTVSWPEENAKLYFYPKPLDNPGLGEKQQNYSVAQLVAKCDFFKPIKQYDNPVTKLELLKLKREKEKDEPRYCLRWACEKIYKNNENFNKACLCHPGKWDHGSTGTKLVDFVREHTDPKSLEKSTILWKPHWTCCRGGWESPGNLKLKNLIPLGCKRTPHRGPLLEEYLHHPRKYKWPDVRFKLYFPKIVSEKWRNALNKYMYNEEKVREICNKFFSSYRTLSDIPRLCDLLRLYLLVVSDHIEFQMKFMDVANQSGSVYYFLTSSNNVDKEKFIQWWFTNYEKIIEDISKK